MTGCIIVYSRDRPIYSIKALLTQSQQQNIPLSSTIAPASQIAIAPRALTPDCFASCLKSPDRLLFLVDIIPNLAYDLRINTKETGFFTSVKGSNPVFS